MSDRDSWKLTAATVTSKGGVRPVLRRANVAFWPERDVNEIGRAISLDVRFGSKADICGAKRHFGETAPVRFGLSEDAGKMLRTCSEIRMYISVWGPICEYETPAFRLSCSRIHNYRGFSIDYWEDDERRFTRRGRRGESQFSSVEQLRDLRIACRA